MTESEKTAQKFTINASQKDRFRMIFSGIPSSEYMENYDDFRDANKDNKFVSLSLKGANIPGVSSDEIKHKVASHQVTDRNHELSFESLSATFSLDENYYLYNLFLVWMYMISYPEALGGLVEQKYSESYYVTAWIIVLNNTGEKTCEYKFIDVHPLSLPTIDLDYSSNEKQTCEITFGYSYYLPDNTFTV